MSDSNYEIMTIEIEVPTEHRRLYEQLLTLTEQNLQTLVNKNEDYGDIRSSAEMLSELDVYDDSNDAFAHRGFSRLTEKHSRYAQLQFNDHNRRVRDEDKTELCSDAVNYWLWQQWFHTHGGVKEGYTGSPWTGHIDTTTDGDRYERAFQSEGMEYSYSPEDTPYQANPSSDEYCDHDERRTNAKVYNSSDGDVCVRCGTPLERGECPDFPERCY